MEATLISILTFSSMFISITASKSQYPTLNCSNESPDIQFPFWVSAHHSHKNFAHPNFELSCKNTTTMIHFPSYGELAVKSISYNQKKLQLFDPKSCVHEVFLNLNLSFTPFEYYYVVKNYTYLNCSTKLIGPFVEVPCLSGTGHHFYTVESSLCSVPVSCKAVKTVTIPFSYSPYLSDNSFGLALTWSLPENQDLKGQVHQGFWMVGLSLGVKFMKVVLCILAVTILISIKNFNSKKLKNRQIERDNLLDGIK